MPGLLTHLIVAFVGFLVVTLSFNYKFGFAFAIGQLIPDVIKFGIPGVMFRTTSFREILSKPIYWQLDGFTHHVYFWILICVLVVVITFVLYKLSKMKKETFKKWLIANIIFFVSIAIHLVLDVLIIEKSYWI